MVSLMIYRFSTLPNLHASRLRLASSNASGTTQLYAFPSHPKPTPHQIFHLPPGASQKDIKLRYYDLVRYHHPDSLYCRSLDPSTRRANFQAITAAYDVLLGKRSRFGPPDPYQEEVMRRKQYQYAYRAHRAQYAHSQQPQWTASEDDRWKDRVLMIAGIITLIAGLVPSLLLLPREHDKQHRSAVSNLGQARREAREFGQERRNEVRKRVHELQSEGRRPRS